MPDGVAAAGSLLSTPIRVVSLGLDRFARDLVALGIPAVHVDWRPPAGGDLALVALLAQLEDDA